MTRLFPAYLLALILGLAAWSCNSDSDSDPTGAIDASSVAVKAFSLKSDDNILPHLDSVYFAIDLQNALIYNADSLPKGTDVSKLVVKISTPAVSACQLIVGRGILGDTIYNYTERQNDSIDFSRPVTLRIVSADGLQTRDYKVTINVHQTAADSLYWNQTMRRDLPSTFDRPTAQKTLYLADQALCVTIDGSGNACAATATHPLGGWTTKSCTLPAGANLRSLCANNDGKLFILDDDNHLWESADLQSWQKTQVTFNHLLGAYGNEVIGTRLTDQGWIIAGYPSIPAMTAPEEFPVEATSNMLVFTTKWSDNPLGMIVGGKKANGIFTGATWAFDGSQWAAICNDRLNMMAYGNMAIVPYRAFRSETYWRVDEQSALLAFGGSGTLGMLSPNVYISTDRGINWSRADQLMQLPDYIEPFHSADVLCFTSTLTATDPTWQSAPDTKLPAWLSTIDGLPSRVSRPVDTWECPALYLFGGIDNNNGLYNNVWHGVINRLTYRPLY